MDTELFVQVIHQSLKEQNIQEFLKLLPKPLTINKQEKILKEINNSLAPEDQFTLGKMLVAHWKPRARKIGDPLLCNYWHYNQNLAKQHFIELAENTDWHIREVAAQFLSVILTHKFSSCYPIMLELMQSPATSINMKRAIILAVKYTIQAKIEGQQTALFNLLLPAFSEPTEYVRKNLGPFVIGDGFFRVYPKFTLQKLRELADNTDQYVRWNVARAFGSSGGNANWPAGQDILNLLATDSRRFVWKAVSAALQYIARRQPNHIKTLVETWKGDKNRQHVAQDVLKFIKF